MVEKALTPEEQRLRMREEIADTIVIIKKVAQYCGNVDDLVGMLQLALQNDGQLTLLMAELAPLQLRRLVG